MGQSAAFMFVFLAGFVMAVAAGVGTIPFFFVSDVNDRWGVALWGVASGIMVSASLLGLVFGGLVNGTPLQLGIGMLAGVVLVLAAHHVIEGAEVNPKQYEGADFRKPLLTLGILTAHSFPEGVVVGASFADPGPDGGFQLSGFVVPLLAVFMTLVTSIHNAPEGLTIPIPLRLMNASNRKFVWWAVFSSPPQPTGVAITFYSVRIARELLPFGLGFVAGAMVFLALVEFIPEAFEPGRCLPRGGRVELLAEFTVGFAVTVPSAFI